MKKKKWKALNFPNRKINRHYLALSNREGREALGRILKLIETVDLPGMETAKNN